MSVPNVAEENPRQEFTIDEMEASTQAAPEAPKPEDIKTPDGKSLAEILERQSRLEESLKLSESARIALQQSAERPRSDVPAPAPQQEREPLTREKLAEIYQEDPIRAIAMMQDDAIERAAAHFETRLNQLQVGTVDAAEGWARQEFADEFSVLGKEIEQFKASIPDQSIFTSKKGWEDLIAYVRGQRGNFDRFIEFKSGKTPRTPDIGRREAEVDMGFSTTSRRNTPIPEAVGDLDPTTAEIATNLFPDLSRSEAIAEYKKWANIEATR